ncbi:Kae1-associated serine/threonine protein kinase [Candidatus Bathyarchaeota archaeon]|nr:Kae1-associated serine/threonine protein kinase [Candidatus Bathyarchaeota archaeon]
MADLKIIAKGAEADIILDPNWNGKKAIIKRRNQKKYRHPMLDENIRRIRTIHEAEIIHRAKESGIPTPLIYLVNPTKAEIIMEYIEGTKIRDIVMTNNDEENTRIFYQIGIQAGKLHKLKIIHGDLTTSNMIKSGNRIVFIDFGLGEISEEVEKRGVDVNLMKKMLTSTHYLKQDILLSAFLKGYVASMDEEAKEVLDRAEEISKRGRYIEKE